MIFRQLQRLLHFALGRDLPGHSFPAVVFPITSKTCGTRRPEHVLRSRTALYSTLRTVLRVE